MELREWSPLVGLVNRIPATVQRGLLFYDVSITCVDMVDEFLALGTNVGIVFWYNRRSDTVEKLQGEVGWVFSSLLGWQLNRGNNFLIKFSGFCLKITSTCLHRPGLAWFMSLLCKLNVLVGVLTPDTTDNAR